MCIPPAIFPNKPPEGHQFQAPDARARAMSLGAPRASSLQIEYIDPTPSAKAMEKMVNAKLSAVELQRQIDEMERRPASTWEGFPSFWAGLASLIMLALILLYAVTR